MITTLYNFAKLLKDDKPLKAYFHPYENPFEGQEEKGKVLVGNIKNGKFKGFELEDFKIEFLNNYLFRSHAPNGTGIIPTIRINLSKADKKGKTGFEKTIGKLESCIENNKQLINQSLADDILNGFKKYEPELEPAFSYIVTFKIDNKWLGEIEKAKEKFNDIAYKKYYDQKTKGKSKKANQMCAISGKTSEVYGFVDTLGFTVNSKSFNRNGFDVENAYKMFPVSKDVIPILEGAQKILTNKLSDFLFKFWNQKDKKIKRFTNIQYAMVPHFVFPPSQEVTEEIAKTFLKKSVLNIDSNEEGATGFINGTERILEEIIEDGDLNRNEIYYSILFYEQQQAQFKIFLELNDVLPSRIGKILTAKKIAEKRYRAYTSYETKDGIQKEQRITLFQLKDYFLTGEKTIQPSFFKLVQSIFTERPYDESKLLRTIIDTWRKSFKQHYFDKQNAFYFLVKNTLGNLYFLNLLGIYKSNYIMSEQTLTTKKQDAFSFLDAHPAYFYKDYLKGTFLFGCLTARLLYNQPGNAFMKELYGLNIDQEIITKKFPKLIAKLRQYDKVFPEMESAAMRYFANPEKVSKDEISFAFTMGLVLQGDFDQINKKKNESNKTENHE